jgi:hypothetical protein
MTCLDATMSPASGRFVLNDFERNDAAKPSPRGPINHAKHNPHGQPLEEVSYRLLHRQF